MHPPGRQMINLIVPISIIVLAIPLILQKIPRNGLYGLRTAFTMSSDEIWYQANKISGVALLCAALLWLALAGILPSVMVDERHAYRLVVLIGTASLIGGCAVAYWLTYKKYGHKD